MGFKIGNVLKDVVKVGAPILGGVIGGPVGAAIGSAISGGLEAHDAGKAAKQAQGAANAQMAMSEAQQKQLVQDAQGAAAKEAERARELAGLSVEEYNRLGDRERAMVDELGRREAQIAEAARGRAEGMSADERSRILGTRQQDLGEIETAQAREQARFRDEIGRITAERTSIMQRLEQARATGDAESVRNLTAQLGEIDTNLAQVQQMAQQSADRTAQTLDPAKQAERQLIEQDIAGNRALLEGYGQTSEQAIGQLGQTQQFGEGLVGQMRELGGMSWKDAAMSDLDARYRDIEAEQARAYASRGGAPKGVSLALAMDKARAMGQLKSQLDQQEQGIRQQNLQATGNMALQFAGLSPQMAQLAQQQAVTMQSDSGAQLANLERYYMQQGLSAQQAADAAAMDMQNQASSQRLGAMGLQHQEKMAGDQTYYAGMNEAEARGNQLLTQAGLGYGQTMDQYGQQRTGIRQGADLSLTESGRAREQLLGNADASQVSTARTVADLGINTGRTVADGILDARTAENTALANAQRMALDVQRGAAGNLSAQYQDAAKGNMAIAQQSAAAKQQAMKDAAGGLGDIASWVKDKYFK